MPKQLTQNFQRPIDDSHPQAVNAQIEARLIEFGRAKAITVKLHSGWVFGFLHTGILIPSGTFAMT